MFNGTTLVTFHWIDIYSPNYNRNISTHILRISAIYATGKIIHCQNTDCDKIERNQVLFVNKRIFFPGKISKQCATCMRKMLVSKRHYSTNNCKAE